MKCDYLVVGAGFAGAVMAERIASQLDKKVIVVEKRNHIGGNAYDEYDEHGILVHRYGPHIFHTNSREVFDYLSMFTEWREYEHKVLAKISNELYPIPINRITLNKFYGLDLKSDVEVEKYFDSIREKRFPIKNSEDIIINQVGKELFDKFFKHYTFKQWNLYPVDLSPTVCGRIPVRTNDDCRYFTDKYQFMPKDGYTKMFERMLAHKNIELVLNTDYKTILDSIKFDRMIYTGPIDYFFDYEFGKLPYRSIRFEYENVNKSLVQDAAVYNYVEQSVDFTRVTEYKHLTGQTSDSSTLSYEYSTKDGEPFYPVPTTRTQNLYSKFEQLVKKNKNTFFCGRLAEYKYYNMDQVVARMLELFKRII